MPNFFSTQSSCHLWLTNQKRTAHWAVTLRRWEMSGRTYTSPAKWTLTRRPSLRRLCRLRSPVGPIERTQQSLTDEIDELEQYSRRNFLVFHGLPENSDAAGNENTTEAILKVAGSLGVHLDAGCIDRSHRMGRRPTSPESAGTRIPRPVIVEFTSYEPRRAIFTSKRELKGTHIVITENLTRRRVDLLWKARDSPNVEASWTSDGRIVCLLTNGRKVTVSECVPSPRSESLSQRSVAVLKLYLSMNNGNCCNACIFNLANAIR